MDDSSLLRRDTVEDVVGVEVLVIVEFCVELSDSDLRFGVNVFDALGGDLDRE